MTPSHHQLALYRRPWAANLARYLDSTLMRIFMVSIVVASVIPEIGVESARWLGFTTFFTVTALLRSLTLIHKTVRTRTDWVLLAADFIVAITFLPWEHWFPFLPERRLHSLWTARLLVMLRPSRTFLQDLWSVLTGREQLQQFVYVTAGVGILAFLSSTILVHLAGPYNYNDIQGTHDDAFIDVLWWTFRQMESADNLVPNLRHDPVLVSVSLLLTVTGVFVIAFIIGIGSNMVEQLVLAQRRRDIDYSAHSVVIGPAQDAEILLRQFVSLYEKNRRLTHIHVKDIWLWLLDKGPRPRRHALPRIAFLDISPEPPDFLFEAPMRKILYRSGISTSVASLSRVASHQARRVLILAKPGDQGDRDAMSLSCLATLRQLNPQASIYVELLDAQNRQLAEAIGGPRTVALDMPRIVGQFLAQHLVVPGVDRVFGELLTADGSEFYTHIFVEPYELQAVERWAERSPTIPWTALVDAAEAYGIILLGVLLGPTNRSPRQGIEAVPTEGLSLWMNPLDEPEHPQLASFSLRAGEIPVAKLGGLVALSATYQEIKRFALSLLDGPPSGGKIGSSHPHPKALDAMPAPVAHRQMAKAFRHDDGQLTRIIIVGESPALIALVAELYLFRPNLHIILVLPNRLDNDEAMAHLAALDLNWQACQGQTQNGGLKIPRHGGQGSLTVYSTSNQALPAMATQLAEEIDELQAAIFLSAEEGLDPDASTSLRVMRFVEAMDKRPWSQTHHLNLLAELHAESRGALLQKDLRKITSNHHGMRLTPVSADRIKHYFMVHSAFVPGVGQIYDELLGEYGQDLMRLDPMDITGVVTYHELREILAPRRMIPIAIELESSTMRLHPQWDEKIDLSQLKALIVLGDTRRDLAHLKAL